MIPRRIITSITDPQRSGKDPVHSGVRRLDDAARLEPLTELGLQMPADGDQNRGGLSSLEVIDQVELLFWSQGGLKDDHLVGRPGAVAGLRRGDRLDLDA